jgi:hypothetical protein
MTSTERSTSSSDVFQPETLIRMTWLHPEVGRYQRHLRALAGESLQSVEA